MFYSVFVPKKFGSLYDLNITNSTILRDKILLTHIYYDIVVICKYFFRMTFPPVRPSTRVSAVQLPGNKRRLIYISNDTYTAVVWQQTIIRILFGFSRDLL